MCQICLLDFLPITPSCVGGGANFLLNINISQQHQPRLSAMNVLSSRWLLLSLLSWAVCPFRNKQCEIFIDVDCRAVRGLFLQQEEEYNRRGPGPLQHRSRNTSVLSTLSGTFLSQLSPSTDIKLIRWGNPHLHICKETQTVSCKSKSKCK